MVRNENSYKRFFDTITSFNHDKLVMIPFFNSQYLFPKFQTPKAAMIRNALYLENSASLEHMAKDEERCCLLLTYDAKNNAWDLMLCQLTWAFNALLFCMAYVHGAVCCQSASQLVACEQFYRTKEVKKSQKQTSSELIDFSSTVML